jgi:Tfp pilus assembly protein PilO
MTRERRVLLVLLAASVLAAILGSLLYAGLDRLRTVDDEIQVLTKQYAKLSAGETVGLPDLQRGMRELKQAEDAELRRYYEAGEMDLYRFGGAVNTLLARQGIVVDDFRTLSGSNGSVLELTARGTSTSFMAFLSDVSSAPKYWTIPYLHVQSRSGDGSVSCEFQIGYMTHDASKKSP